MSRRGASNSLSSPPNARNHQESFSEEDDWDVYCGGSHEAPFSAPPHDLGAVFGTTRTNREENRVRFRPGGTRTSRDLPPVGSTLPRQPSRLTSPVPPCSATERAADAGPLILRGQLTLSVSPPKRALVTLPGFWVCFLGVICICWASIKIYFDTPTYHYTLNSPPFHPPPPDPGGSRRRATVEAIPPPSEERRPHGK